MFPFYGAIILWYGSAESIPAGWHLCDGDSGTPDLRNSFVIGAGSTYDPDENGGTDEHFHAVNCGLHTHTATQPAHRHNLVSEPPFKAEIGTNLSPSTSYIQPTITVEEVDIGGATNYKSHMPPYYALCYIMYLGV